MAVVEAGGAAVVQGNAEGIRESQRSIHLGGNRQDASSSLPQNPQYRLESRLYPQPKSQEDFSETHVASLQKAIAPSPERSGAASGHLDPARSRLSFRFRAQSANKKTFSSPGDAALALYVAAKSDDSGSLNAIFGSNADKVLHTGDEVADKNLLSRFASHYDQMHRVVIEPDQTATLYIGADNWPMPISLVKNTSGAGISTRKPESRRFFTGASAITRTAPSKSWKR